MFKAIRISSLALIAVAPTATVAIAGEYQCRLDDSALRIAIEVKKAGHTLPCEVVSEDDRNNRAVLFSAQFDRAYCPKRLEQKRTELEEQGWDCRESSAVNIVRGEGKLLPEDALLATRSPATSSSNGAIVAEQRVCKLNDDTRRLQIEVENPNSGKPCKLVYWSESDQSDSGQLLWRAEHDSEFCTKRLSFIVQKWGDEGWQCGDGDGQVQAVALPAPTEEPSTSLPAAENAQAAGVVEDQVLQSIIEADAKRIGEWMEVEPDIEVAAHGDLNADGTDDAVVFLAYQSKQAAYRQYMMSYLVADETYELAGVKLLTGVNPPPKQAKVEQIEKGIIWLSLPGTEGTRLEPVGYVLRDQQLVEVDKSKETESASN